MKGKHKQEIAILGKKIQTEIKDIDIQKLSFWIDNPRVNSVIKQKFVNSTVVTDNEIENILRDEEHVKELLQDINTHGGLIDEILVKGNIVLEGNSRLCAYRMLYEKASNTNNEDDMLKWSYIKCKIIPDDTTEEEIFTILGTWHIKGKKQWDTFEKAAYLKRMKDIHNHSCNKIAEMIGESENFVKSNIEAHDLMVINEIYDLSKFSYFLEMVKNKNINQEQEKDGQTRKKIIEAIKNNQFNRAEEIRDLYKVLKDKVAKRDFFNQQLNFQEALDIAIDRHPELDGALYNLFKKTTEKLNKISAKQVATMQEEIKSEPQKKFIVSKFQTEVKKFCKRIGVQ